jgi:tetratricopeptide (TPR) repeat protein
MWLQHCTDKRTRGIAGGLLLALLLAGCSSSGPTQKSSDRGRDAAPTASGAVTNLTPAGQTLFEQAAAAMAGGDLLDAELRFKEFLLQYPGVSAAWVNLAIIHVSNGNEDAAQDAIDQALAADPNFAPALNQLGMLLRRNGNFQEAEAAYLKAVTVSPEYALAHYNLGVLNELYLQRLDVALQHFEQYQALVGDDEQVEKWIADLERRVAANQRTANVAE